MEIIGRKMTDICQKLGLMKNFEMILDSRKSESTKIGPENFTVTPVILRLKTVMQ